MAYIVVPKAVEDTSVRSDPLRSSLGFSLKKIEVTHWGSGQHHKVSKSVTPSITAGPRLLGFLYVFNRKLDQEVVAKDVLRITWH